MKEIWKDIKGYEGIYQVSNLGRVKSLGNNKTKKEKILKPAINRGYLRITIQKDGINKKKYVHRLVAETFIPNSEKKPQVNHINCKKDDNRVCNLEWCTNGENQKHAWDNGLKINVGRPIEQYSLDGKLIEVWDRIVDATKKYNVYHSSIVACCRGKLKKTGGYIWKYKD